MTCQDSKTEQLLQERTEQLRACEARFRNIVSTSADGIVIVDGVGVIQFLNPAAEAIFNRTAEELVGALLGFPLVADQTTELDIIQKGGNQIVAEMRVVATEWEGEPAYLATIRDISDRRRDELELRKLYRAVSQSSSIVMITDVQGAIEYVNPKFTEVTGYTAAEVMGLNPRILQSGLTPPETYARLWSTLARGEQWHGEFINKKKNGETYHEAASVAPVADADGIVTHFVAVKEDVTERKRAEQALRESEALFRVIFDQAFQLMALLRCDGTLLKVNQSAAAFLESGVSELLGRFFWDTPWWTHDPEQQERLRAAVRTAAGGEFVRFESTHLTPEGKSVWIDFSLKPVMDEEGKVILLVPEGRDISDSKRAAEEIRNLNARLAARVTELEEINEELEAFNRIVSHDLRQPLNTIGISCQTMDMITRDTLDEEFRKYLKHAYAGVLTMNKLITSLLDFSRTTHREVARASFDIAKMAQAVFEELRVADPARPVTFICPEKAMANADPELMRSVLENLLGNAWKYTGGKEAAVIEFGSLAIADLEAYVVRDNGTGFDPAEAARLFKPFSRLSGTEGIEGIGIGLATVERIIRRHGGRIWAESEPGRGASFYFTLASRGSAPTDE